MTREEIIRMAREAGFSVTWPETVVNFERFAALVAKAEREACADVCDGEAKFWKDDLRDWGRGFYAGAKSSAHAIRARGEE